MFIRKHIILFKPYFIHVVFLLRNKSMHARGILFREAFSGAFFRNFVPEKPSGHPFQGLRPRKACMEKGANKLPEWEYIRDMPKAYPLSGNLGR
jgi:hypothetical protein